MQCVSLRSWQLRARYGGTYNNPSTWKQGWKNCLFGASLGDQKILTCLPFPPGKNNKGGVYPM